MAELEASIDAAHTALSRLENRLDIVISPESNPTEKPGDRKVELSGSVLLNKLRRSTGDIHLLIVRIEALTDTVEI
jgi:hypothetical protein